MSDDVSTTDDSTEDQAPQEGRPEESIEASAESQRSDVPPQEAEAPEEETNEEPSTEDDSTEDQDELVEWAKNQGIDPNDPKAALKMARENQRFGKEQQQSASELKKKFSQDSRTQSEATGRDPDFDAELTEMRLNNFWASNPEAKAIEEDMTETYLKYTETDPAFANHLRKNIGTLYDITRANKNAGATLEARQQGKKDALESTARSQASAAPKSNATNQADSSKVTAKKVQQWSSNKEDFMKHRDEIMAWEKAQLGLK